MALTKERAPDTGLAKPRAQVRQSNFELLRILLMLMIVACHLCSYGELYGTPATPWLSKMLVYLLGSGGKIGVDGFVLLSGYFLCTSRAGFQPKRLLKLYLQIFFYSAGLFFGLYAAGMCRMHPDDALNFLLPVTQGVYWFASAYFILFLLSPFLNRLIQGMDRKNYRLLLLISFAVFSLVPTFLRVKYQIPHLVWFFFLYLLAGYVRLHPEPIFDKKWLALAAAVGGYIVCAGYYPVYSRLQPQIYILRYVPMLQHTPGNSVPALLCALGLFLFFKNLDIKGSRVINTVASATFGVYLIHEHGLRVRRLLWQELFDCRPLLNRPAALLGHALLAILIVFAAGIAFDLFRQYALERPLFKCIDKTKFGKKVLRD